MGAFQNIQAQAATPVVLAFTKNYIVPAATCILSILDHADREDTFHFICLSTEQTQKHVVSKFEKLVGDRATFSFINMVGQLTDIYIDEKYTVAASYRLLLPALLPQFDKAIYVDCDIIVRNNLAKLFRSVDLDKYYMAGVFETTLPEQVEHLDNIGCRPGEYMNSGFLLMNLKKLREDDMVTQFLEASKNKSLQFPDQDVINILCKGQLLALPPYWNAIRTLMVPTYKALFLAYYSNADWEDVQKNGNVHYTGPKPWNSFSVAFDIWWNYFYSLPEDFRSLIHINKKLYFLSFVYRNRLGKMSIDAIRNGYRCFRR